MSNIYKKKELTPKELLAILKRRYELNKILLNMPIPKPTPKPKTLVGKGKAKRKAKKQRGRGIFGDNIIGDAYNNLMNPRGPNVPRRFDLTGMHVGDRIHG